MLSAADRLPRRTDMNKIYATRDEAINQAIIPAFDDADAYDLDAIAARLVYQEDQ